MAAASFRTCPLQLAQFHSETKTPIPIPPKFTKPLRFSGGRPNMSSRSATWAPTWSNRFLKEMYIPDELLHADLEVEPAVHIPKFPVLVFIDMKNMNNKQLGEKLLDKFRYHLNKKQVFAVLEEKSDTKKKVKAHDPERVLKDVYGTLEKLKRKGYGFADEIQKTMTVIIVGGDSVANWILGVICDLKLPELPSIAPIPLQTISLIGGSISSSFGWLELQFEDREMQFMVAPLHAAIIMQFQDQKSCSWGSNRYT